MSRTLTSLVRAADDPTLTVYAINRLSAAPEGGRYCTCTANILRQFIGLLARQGYPEIFFDKEEQKLRNQLFRQSTLNLFLHHLSNDSSDVLIVKLSNQNPTLRLLAVTEVGRRHIHLEKTLIEHLKEPHPALREAAHQALVRVGRGTDFGPLPGFSQTSITRSIEKWRHWLVLQAGESPITIAKEDAATANPSKINSAKAVHFILDHGERELQTVSSEAKRLSEGLVKARDSEQKTVLARLRDAKGIDNTDALALAIPKLSMGAAQREARDALAQRLTRMTAKTLRAKMQEDDVEVRRAAASACGRKKATEHIPDLLALLDDPAVAVIQAARKALKDLTGEDFGPDESAGRRGRTNAAAVWRKWWKEHSDEAKGHAGNRH